MRENLTPLIPQSTPTFWHMSVLTGLDIDATSAITSMGQTDWRLSAVIVTTRLNNKEEQVHRTQKLTLTLTLASRAKKPI